MTPTVFISHSCKDNELAPPDGLSAQAVEARAARLRFARQLRDRIYARLEQDGRCEVFLDVRGGLNPGDLWQEGLHMALRSCAAGVMLLSPESLESGWVLKEATILSWRVFLHEPVILIPVVLGVTDEELSQRGFGALSLDRIQWVKVMQTDDAAIEHAVEQIHRTLIPTLQSRYEPAAVLSPTEHWIHTFAYQLGEVVPQSPGILRNDCLRRMCEALSISAEERARFDRDPLVNLASQVLVARADQIVRFLNQAGAPNKLQRETLMNAVTALWVDPTPASRLLLNAEIGRVVAIDTRETRVAREYVLRGHCNDIAPDRIVEPSDVTGGSEREVLDEIEATLSEVLPIENAAALDADVADNGPAFVILGPGAVRPSVLESLTGAYPQLSFVLAAGSAPQETLGDWLARTDLLHPLLQPGREMAAARYRTRLVRFVTGGVPR